MESPTHWASQLALFPHCPNKENSHCHTYDQSRWKMNHMMFIHLFTISYVYTLHTLICMLSDAEHANGLRVLVDASQHIRLYGAGLIF
jgi:hypothetical protein